MMTLYFSFLYLARASVSFSKLRLKEVMFLAWTETTWSGMKKGSFTASSARPMRLKSSIRERTVSDPVKSPIWPGRI